MRGVFFGVACAMLLLPFAARGQTAPQSTPAPGEPVACAQATATVPAAAAGLDGLSGVPEPIFLSTCTCTSAAADCRDYCLSLGCLGHFFTCYTPDPCDSDCTCSRCIA